MPVSGGPDQQPDLTILDAAQRVEGLFGRRSGFRNRFLGLRLCGEGEGAEQRTARVPLVEPLGQQLVHPFHRIRVVQNTGVVVVVSAQRARLLLGFHA